MTLTREQKAEWYKTPLGLAFQRFEASLGNAGVADCAENVSPKRLKAVWETADKWREELIDILHERALPLPEGEVKELVERLEGIARDCVVDGYQRTARDAKAALSRQAASLASLKAHLDAMTDGRAAEKQLAATMFARVEAAEASLASARRALALAAPYAESSCSSPSVLKQIREALASPRQEDTQR